MTAAEQLLLNQLNEVFEGFKININNLRDPSEEFVIDFLAFFLSEFEVDPNNVLQMHFSQTVIISSYQDSFSGIVPKLNLMKAIKELNVIPDFGLRDITSPTPKRTQNVLRALMNFYQWADAIVGGVITKKEEMNYLQRKKTIRDLLAKKDHMKETQNNIFKEIGQLQMEEVKSKEESEKAKERYNEIRLAKEVAKKEREEPSSGYQGKEAALLKLEKEMSQVKNKIKEYSSLIIDSPTILLGDLQSLRAKEKELEKNRNEKRDTLETKMKTSQIVRQALEDQHLRAEEVAVIFELIKQAKIAGRDFKTQEKKIKAQREKLKEARNNLLKWQKKSQERICFSEELKLREDNLIDGLKKCLEAVKIEQNEKEERKKSIRQKQKDAAVVQDKIDSALEEATKLTEDFEKFYIRSTEVFQQNFEEGMAKTEAMLQEMDSLHIDE